MSGYFLKLSTGLALAAFCFCSVGTFAAETYLRPSIEGVQARAFLLVDGATGKIIAQRNPHQQHPPASVTKLMTALLVYQTKGINGRVKIIASDTKVEPSHVPLIVGETVSVVDLMHAMAIGSDNDAAKALARYTGGSDADFIAMMNDRARALGCRNTVFRNPNGLPKEGMYTTASDLMIIFRKATSIPDLALLFRTKVYVLKTAQGRQTIKNHNKLLGKYPGMSSAKTGWTYSSRHTYAAVVKRNGREVYLTLLNSPNKWRDAVALFDYGFDHLPPVTGRVSQAPAAEVVPTEVQQVPTPSGQPSIEVISQPH